MEIVLKACGDYGLSENYLSRGLRYADIVNAVEADKDRIWKLEDILLLFEELAGKEVGTDTVSAEVRERYNLDAERLEDSFEYYSIVERFVEVDDYFKYEAEWINGTKGCVWTAQQILNQFIVLMSDEEFERIMAE